MLLQAVHSNRCAGHTHRRSTRPRGESHVDSWHTEGARALHKLKLAVLGLDAHRGARPHERGHGVLEADTKLTERGCVGGGRAANHKVLQLEAAACIGNHNVHAIAAQRGRRVHASNTIRIKGIGHKLTQGLRGRA